MPLTTPQSLISFSLRAAGILGVGQSALAEDYQDAFDALNGMMGQWNRKRWLIYNLLDISIVTTGAQTYSIGPGCDFNVPRIDRLEAAFLRQFVTSAPGQNEVDFPLDILQSREDYNDIALKQLTTWPTCVFLDAGNPTGTIYPWPIPSAGIFELHLTVKNHLAQFTSYTQQVNLPDEYTEAIWSNLTIRLCAIYPGAVLTPAVEALAKASISSIRVANTQIPRLQMPTGMVRPPLYNIYSGRVYAPCVD